MSLQLGVAHSTCLINPAAVLHVEPEGPNAAETGAPVYPPPRPCERPSYAPAEPLVLHLRRTFAQVLIATSFRATQSSLHGEMGSGEVGSGSGSGSGEIVNPGSGSGTFATKADLQAAVGLWVSNKAAASSAHGPIAGWGVSSIMDMSWLFYDSMNFNEDISSWDTSSVTDMQGMFQVRRPPRAGSA